MDKLVFLSKTNSLSVGGDVPLKHLSVFEEIVFKFKEDGFTPEVHRMQKWHQCCFNLINFTR
jgi:hypothetical protein